MRALSLHQRVGFLLLGTGLVLAGCASRNEAGKRRYEFVLRVQSDPGQPLAGAVVSNGKKPLGTSDASGKVSLRTHGVEGEILSLQVRCPAGYRSPAKPLSVVLRHSVDANVRPEYDVSCPPEKRTLVVAVRAENGPGLPIRHFGREVGRTDESGAAHVVLQAASEEAVELTLDTSERPKLRPSNPTARFRLSQRDEVTVFTQRFEAAPAPRARAARAKTQRGPIRITE